MDQLHPSCPRQPFREMAEEITSSCSIRPTAARRSAMDFGGQSSLGMWLTAMLRTARPFAHIRPARPATARSDLRATSLDRTSLHAAQDRVPPRGVARRSQGRPRSAFKEQTAWAPLRGGGISDFRSVWVANSTLIRRTPKTDAMMSLNALREKTSDADMLREMIGFAAER